MTIKPIFSILILLSVILTQQATAQNADIELLRKINVNRNTSLDNGFIFISKTVTPFVIGVPVGVLATGFIAKDSVLKRKGLYIATTIFVTAATATLLKHSIKRVRPFNTYPDIEKVDGGGSPSFPSGHTSDAFAVATSVSLAFPKWYVITPAYLWASSVGYSRMHLGVHYPTDVLAGMIIGSGSAFVCHKINQHLQKRKK